jgi:DNA adenine methylase
MVKPLISYYGGKQRLVSKIVPYFPQHTVYVEPFCGGASMLFAKPILKTKNGSDYREIINDVNEHITNLYRIAKTQPEELIKMIDATLFSQADHKKAFEILKKGTYSNLEQAWATYIQCNCSFSKQMFKGWSTSIVTANNGHTWNNRKKYLAEQISRLDEVIVSCEDALKCIERFDSPHTFFYCDPPYPNCYQGHYGGYTQKNFEDLIEVLKNIKGSFILSNYHNEAVPKDWKMIEFEASMSACVDHTIDKKRIEVIWIKESTITPRSDILKIYAKQKSLKLI